MAYFLPQVKNKSEQSGLCSDVVDPRRIELPNLTDANRALSQLSYGPICGKPDGFPTPHYLSVKPPACQGPNPKFCRFSYPGGKQK